MTRHTFTDQPAPRTFASRRANLLLAVCALVLVGGLVISPALGSGGLLHAQTTVEADLKAASRGPAGMVSVMSQSTVVADASGHQLLIATRSPLPGSAVRLMLTARAARPSGPALSHWLCCLNRVGVS